MKTAIFATATALLAVSPAFSQAQATRATGSSAPTLTVNGQIPGPHGYIRCATPQSDPTQSSSFAPPSDCSANRTVPNAVYSPANLDEVQIKVVFHVIRRANGTGNVPNSRVNSQIDILNEDFGALSGTPGAPGVDTKVRFVLADTDPNGAATTGIVRYDNSTWYNDGGSYYNTIAWDPDVYMNIYTLGAPQGSSGILGYVPFLPASSPNSVGANRDRVVVLNGAVGRNAPAAPYNQGRTLTHEIGHFLGLNHTFNGGCGGGSCNTSGDLICDTNAESSPEYNCPGSSSSCGSQDPVHNYMDYSPDTCMNNFTEEQARRIRCTLEFYRPALAAPSGPVLGENYCALTPNSASGGAALTGFGTKSIANNDFAILATALPPNAFGFFIVSDTQGLVMNPGGSQGNLCIGGTIGRYLSQVANSGPFGEITLVVDVNAIPQPSGTVGTSVGQTWNFQAWFRDVNPALTSNFSDAYTITFE